MLLIKKIAFFALFLIPTQVISKPATQPIDYGKLAQIAISSANIIENIYAPNSNIALAATCAEAVLAYTQNDYGFFDYVGVALASIPVALCAELICPQIKEKRARYIAITLSLFRLKNMLKKNNKEPIELHE